MLKSKTILIGLTGGIAIYKSASLVRHLVTDYECDVTVVMTDAAQQFMTPLIFETFTGKPVMTAMFEKGVYVGTRHIDTLKGCDQLLVVPATANIIAKAACGIADDLLSTMILAARNRVSFALAMNNDMYRNPITTENIMKLSELNYGILHPEAGDLACNTYGEGHLAGETEIIEFLDARINGRNQWKDKTVLVTAGPTREYIDNIRFITNRSTGKMGYAIAREAVNRGAKVTLVSGPSHLSPPPVTRFLHAESAAEMNQAVSKYYDQAEIVFMTAAVEDIKPEELSSKKLKKDEFPSSLRIEKNIDILNSLGQRKKKQFLIGFGVETDRIDENAQRKMKSKNLDMIIMNNPEENGAGFAVDTNIVQVYDSDLHKTSIPRMSKRLIAKRICDLVNKQLGI